MKLEPYRKNMNTRQSHEWGKKAQAKINNMEYMLKDVIGKLEDNFYNDYGLELQEIEEYRDKLIKVIEE